MDAGEGEPYRGRRRVSLPPNAPLYGRTFCAGGARGGHRRPIRRHTALSVRDSLPRQTRIQRIGAPLGRLLGGIGGRRSQGEVIAIRRGRCT